MLEERFELAELLPRLPPDLLPLPPAKATWPRARPMVKATSRLVLVSLFRIVSVSRKKKVKVSCLTHTAETLRKCYRPGRLIFGDFDSAR